MAYSVDLRAAARRHLDAAQKLLKERREDVAAYLFGTAAECAIKEMARAIPSCRGVPDGVSDDVEDDKPCSYTTLMGLTRHSIL
jgi:hypothetical protein